MRRFQLRRLEMIKHIGNDLDGLIGEYLKPIRGKLATS